MGLRKCKYCPMYLADSLWDSSYSSEKGQCAIYRAVDLPKALPRLKGNVFTNDDCMFKIKEDPNAFDNLDSKTLLEIVRNCDDPNRFDGEVSERDIIGLR